MIVPFLPRVRILDKSNMLFDGKIVAHPLTVLALSASFLSSMGCASFDHLDLNLASVAAPCAAHYVLELVRAKGGISRNPVGYSPYRL